MVRSSVAGMVVRAGVIAVVASVGVGWMAAAGPAAGMLAAPQVMAGHRSQVIDNRGPQAAGARPAGREWASFAYDPGLHELVLFGGDNGRKVLGDTWTWAHGRWTQRHPEASPSPRTGAAMTYDAATGQLLLFGGSRLIGTGGGFNGGTWVWTGQDWRRLRTATSPAARHNADIIYDAATQNVVMFGGYDGRYLGDTWTWDGTTWTQQHPPTAPAPRDTGSFVFDAATGTGLVYGGFDGFNRFTDTWTWNNAWTRQNPASTPADPTFAWMAGYDAVTEQVLLFGKNGGQTWAWNGATWTRQFPDLSPPSRANGSMADNTATSRLMLFGGQSAGNPSRYLNDLWAWNGATWQRYG